MSYPIGAGVGLKPQHYADALACASPGLWFEVHPENYYVDGGPRLAWLETIRAAHPVALHGVSLSLAAPAPPAPAQLEDLARLVRRLDPVLVSEHLAWSSWRGHYYPDLLPLVRTGAALSDVAANIGRMQDALGRRIALENPSHYLELPGHEWGETDFLAELVRRTGCALLVDVNNVHVSAHNLGGNAAAWLDAIPATAVAEIHLAGHSADQDAPLLIDSHDAPVGDAVWQLYRRLIDRIGPRPTLIERDGHVPAWAELAAERDIAQAVLDAAGAPLAAEAPP